MEKPIVFKNRKNEQLFGMLFVPDCYVSSTVGVLISVNAIKYRIGTCRLHAIIARQLCAKGYHVFYFDPSGIGDSEGVFEEKSLNEHHIEIQKGKYLEDTIDAINFFRSYLKLDHLVLAGLCGGAVSMLIAAGTDNRVEGVILVSIPIFIDELNGTYVPDEEIDMITSEVMASRVLVDIGRKFFGAETWRKIITFEVKWKSELKTMRRALVVFMRKMFLKAMSWLFRLNKSIVQEAPVSNHPRFNMLIQKAFFSVVKRGRAILFIFADQDFVTWQFKSEFQDHVFYPGNPYENLCDINVIAKANHVFSTENSQARLLALMQSWLQVHFPIER
jgi:uncharacterized protein